MAIDYEKEVITDASDFTLLSDYVPGIVQEIRYFSTYNFIGLLSQCGEDLCRLVLHFDYMPELSSRADFERYLKKRISYHLRGTKIDKDKKLILNTYKEHDNIYKLLLALNIHLLNEQNQKLESDSDVYKFPFDVLSAQNWDIEHVDSFHTNALKKEKDKIEWVKTAMEDRSEELTKEEREQIQQNMEEKAYDTAIDILKKNAKEVEVDEEIKNSIGNLTLLDAATNRMYGIHLCKVLRPEGNEPFSMDRRRHECVSQICL